MAAACARRTLLIGCKQKENGQTLILHNTDRTTNDALRRQISDTVVPPAHRQRPAPCAVAVREAVPGRAGLAGLARDERGRPAKCGRWALAHCRAHGLARLGEAAADAGRMRFDVIRRLGGATGHSGLDD